MTDKPIIFSGPMVRAIIDGRKTQTRRVLKPQPRHGLEGAGEVIREDYFVWEARTGHVIPFTESCAYQWREYLPYQPGDRLYVKEAWRTEPKYDHMPPRDVPLGAPLLFECDDERRADALGLWGRYRHARFMPRRFSRLTLYVTANKVERLQEISLADARAEGSGGGTPIFSFTILWDDINAKRAGCRWEDNPWGGAYTFKPIMANIDSLDHAA